MELPSVWASLLCRHTLASVPTLEHRGQRKKMPVEEAMFGHSMGPLHDLVIKIGTKPTMLDDK